MELAPCLYPIHGACVLRMSLLYSAFEARQDGAMACVSPER